MVVLDGLNFDKKFNVNLNFVQKIWDNYPHAIIDAYPKRVNAYLEKTSKSIFYESLGAGRLIEDNKKKLDDIFRNLNLKDNKCYEKLIDYLSDEERALHIIVDGSCVNLVLKFLDRIKREKIYKIYIHLVGNKNKDVYSNYLVLEDKLNEYSLGKIASITGENYVFNSNLNWKMTRLFTDLLSIGKGVKITNLKETLYRFYQKHYLDNDLPPITIDNVFLNDNDVLLFFDYSHNVSQVLTAMCSKTFKEYPTIHFNNLKVYSLLEQNNVKVNGSLFDFKSNEGYYLGEYFSNLGLEQYRITDISGSAYINEIFDGTKKKLSNIERFNITSLDKEEEVIDISKQVIKGINNDIDFILTRFDLKNNLSVLDECLSAINDEVESNFYTMIIIGTSDERNGKIPFIVTDKKVKINNGDILEVAPFLLKYMDIKVIDVMKDSGDLSA